MNERPEITTDGSSIFVTVPAGSTLDELRSLGATWDSPRGAWKLPAVGWLLRACIDMVPDAEVSSAALGISEAVVADVSRHPRAKDLYPFQRIGAGRLLASDGQLLCMSPGLGKTATSIVAADLTGGTSFLVVCPASLMHTWRREIEAWSSEKSVEIAHGKLAPLGLRWCITSYETFVRRRDWFDRPKNSPWDVVILDESVMVKSRDSQRFKRLLKVRTSKQAKRMWLLSGFPSTRYPDDLWAQFHLIRPKAFSSYWRFAERYCYVQPNTWGPGKTVVGPRRGMDVGRDNSDLMYVLHQRDALELPEYLFEAVDVVLEGRQKKAYDDMLVEFIAELNGKEIEAESKIARLTRLQQLVSGLGILGERDSAKHDALIDLILADVYEPPYLIWTHWKDSARYLEDRLIAIGHTTGWAHGGLTKADKDHLLESFKAGKLDSLILSLGVGKYGHTLTNAKTIFYVDKTFSADDYTQSLHRTRRIGLTHRPVVVTIRAPKTVDVLVERNLEGKLGSIAKVTNGELRDLLLGLGR